MEAIDKKRFAELMAGLAQTFVTDISTQDLENYWRFLRAYPIASIEKAILAYCVSPEGHKFMPKPGEIVAALNGKNSEKSLLAWTKVIKAIRKVGASKTVIFDDSIIHSVIDDMGGWIRLCGLQERELIFQQREFERLYQCHVNHPRMEYPRQLAGIVETTNAASGYALQQDPVLIGDAVQASLVFKQGGEFCSLSYRTLPIRQIMKLGATSLQQSSLETNVLDKNNSPGENSDN